MSVRISIVVPAFDSEATIAATLESALAQSRSADEIVVVDDGSRDGTPVVVERFAPRVRLVRQRNAGVGAARNHGARETTGEWIVFLDADDLLEPDALERHLAVASERPGCDLVGGDGVAFDERGVTATSLLASGLAGRLRAGEASVELSYEAIVRFNPFTTPGQTMIARPAFERVGGFSERNWFSEDWDMWLRLARDHALVAHPASVLRYRIRETSRSGPSRERAIRWGIARVPVIREHLVIASGERRALLETRFEQDVREATMAAYYLGRYADRRLALGYLARLAWSARMHSLPMQRLLALTLPDRVAGSVSRLLQRVIALGRRG